MAATRFIGFTGGQKRFAVRIKADNAVKRRYSEENGQSLYKFNAIIHNNRV